MPVLQDYPEPPFLEWEYRLYLDLLKMPMSNFDANFAKYDSAIKYKRKLTINHFRRQIPGVTPHPDERGDKFVFDLAEVRDNDNVIPPEALVGAWNKVVMSFDSMEQHRPDIELLKALYPELLEEARATKLPLLEEYPTREITYNPPPEPEVKQEQDLEPAE